MAAFVAWAGAHRLAPHAWFVARSVEPALARRLEPLALASRARELDRSAWLARVLSALAESGVHPVVFKGLGVAHLYYPHFGLRPLGDVDLIFSACELDRAVTTLETLGFRTDQRPLVAQFHREVNYNIPMSHARHGLLEAHFSLYEDLPPWFVERLIERSSTTTVLGVPVLAPSADDLFLLLSAHFCSSKPGSNFGWLLDLVLVGRKMTGPEWRSLTETAKQTGTQAFVVATLGCILGLWGVEFDDAESAYSLGSALTVLERGAVAALRGSVAAGRTSGSSLCYARRLSGRPVRRGWAWVTELAWPHAGDVCLSLQVDYSPSTFWWHRTRHACKGSARRLGNLLGMVQSAKGLAELLNGLSAEGIRRSRIRAMLGRPEPKIRAGVHP